MRHRRGVHGFDSPPGFVEAIRSRSLASVLPSWLPTVAVVGLVSLVGCADIDHDEPFRPEESTRSWRVPIVGGEPASADEFPSVAAFTNRYADTICTGTVVSPRLVLTAAHCLFGWSADLRRTDDVRVVLGFSEPDRAPPGERRQVRALVVHPLYAPRTPVDEDGMGEMYDVGLVVLDAPVGEKRVARILPRSKEETVLVPGQDIQIVGYGLTSLDDSEFGRLHQGHTPLIRRSGLEFIAGKQGKPDTCTGDSGGPAFVTSGGVRWLAGVTSRAWRGSQQECGEGGIYTMAGQVEQWIREVEEQAADAGSPEPDEGGEEDGRGGDVDEAGIGPTDSAVHREGSADGVPSVHEWSVEPGGGCSCRVPVGKKLPRGSEWWKGWLVWVGVLFVVRARRGRRTQPRLRDE